VLALLVLMVGVVAMAINEWMAAAKHEVLLISLLVGPTVTLLGLAGLWEPAALWSLGPRQKGLPRRTRWLGVAAVTLGVLVTIWLAFTRYRLFP
jgi:xanthine/uracil permease